MRWSHRAGALLLAGAAVVHADLARWIQDIPSPSRLQAVFFRPMSLPGGTVEGRRPPKETRAALTKLIGSASEEAELYALRAHEAELQLDFAAAEDDWKAYARKARDRRAAQWALADFYHRRIQPREEIAALEEVGRAPASSGETLQSPHEQQSWKAYARIQQTIAEQALPAALASAGYRGWIERYPREPEVYRQALLAKAEPLGEAEKVLAEYRRVFPNDPVFPIRAEAELAERRGSPRDALRIYDQAFQPLWPPELIKAYFDLLKQTQSLRRFLEDARARVQAHPADLGPAARISYYFQQQENEAAAARPLLEFRLRNPSSTPEQLRVLGRLMERVHKWEEAAGCYQDLYRTGAAHQETALAALANLLLDAPDQPIRLGAGDLSFYRDVAKLDPGPGFLNGTLSLLLNSTAPGFQYATENQASVAYFHRAKASELIAELGKRFPQSPERSALHEKLIRAYAVYGDDAGVLRAGREFLASFPKAAERPQVLLTMADAWARRNNSAEEFAIYDAALSELAAQAGKVPLGENKEGKPAARSPEYARVLDRYVARLVALRRLKDALALYRREIDHNPDDPGLYERLAGFLDQNKLGADVEQVYKRAISQFQDRAWSSKLARWYLRRKQAAQFEALTRDVVKLLPALELEAYLKEASQGQTLAPVLYRQVNLYAHQRFPNDLAFVRNLVSAYEGKGAADPAAREALLRAYWFYAPDLRDRFFEMLSRAGKLKLELAALPKAGFADNPAAALFAGEAEAWQGHFEAAAPFLRASAADYPGDKDRQTRVASLYRSLATFDSEGDQKNTSTAAELERNVTKYDPRDAGAWARVGEIYADRGRVGEATQYWNRIASLEPGKAGSALEAATVFWDYYRFDDALGLIEEGRRRESNAHLYSYEAGAIHENRREYGAAIREYIQGALASPEDGQARERLVQLSLRAGQQAAIDELTAKAAAGPGADESAVRLRIQVLSAQNRDSDLRRFLLAQASESASPQTLRLIDGTAGSRGLEEVRERAKVRQIELIRDPVERMQAQIALARFLESRQRPADAARVIAELLKAHPTVLGVVRAAADFYWRVKDSARAVDTLAQAAAQAQPLYRDSFTLEAARKATEAGDVARARMLLAPLLRNSPFQARYVAAMAATYARQNDDQGLRDYFNGRLQALQSEPLPALEKSERTASLRRGLIPVLTRLQDYAGATDQYIEALNRYPEDETLLREAALFAVRHGRVEQLTTYYRNTSRQAPKDFRWPMLEARLQTQAENFPAAVAAYIRASELRPDRVELYSERAALQERLLQFDEAAATYAKLYDLTYHNSQWMERVAAVRARQGQAAAAVKALNIALVEGRAPKPEVFFSVAQRLESWDLLSEAKEYAEKGVAAAGGTLLTDYASGAGTYLRVMTRLRQYPAAYQKLASLAQGKPLPAEALQPMGDAVRVYYTPEEKAALAAYIGARIRAFLPAIQTAGLYDLQARALAKEPDQLMRLQQRRLQFGELAAQLEAFWKNLPPEAENRDSYLDLAAANYRLAAEPAGEIRVLTLKNKQGTLEGAFLDRYAELMTRTPQRMEVALSPGGPEKLRDAVANTALRSGNEQRAFQALAGRARGMPPVWARAYTAMTGLFFLSNTALVKDAFRQALGTGTIGERVGKPVDRSQQLAGDVWFYFGSRYGEYLDGTHQGGAEDYLPAGIEARPGSSDAYFDMGEYFRETGKLEAALTEYGYALELAPSRGDAHDRRGAILNRMGRRDQAIEEFRQALNAFGKDQDLRGLHESFWLNLKKTLEDIGAAKAGELLRPESERLLRTYIRRNGSFRVDDLLQGALAAAGSPAAGISWIIELSKAAPEPALFLAAEVNAEWIPEEQRALVYRALVDAARSKPEMEQELSRYELQYATYLVEHKRAREAQAASAHLKRAWGLQARIAAQQGSVPALLKKLAADPEADSHWEELRNAATDVEKEGNSAAARQLLEFVYTRQLEARQLDPATFLGLAEIRLADGDVPGATTLLRRMTLVSGEPFENLMPAAALLIRTGHLQEAQPFLKQRVRAVPWDAAARVELARVEGSTEGLQTLARSTVAPYEARFAAELILRPAVSPAEAEKPYSYLARLAAAAQIADPAVKARLLRAAVAIDPTPEQPKVDLLRALLAAKRWQTAVACSQGYEPQDAAFKRDLAQAYEQTGDLERARMLYSNAQDRRDAKRMEAELERRAANETRRPVVTAHVEQDHAVRARLRAAGAGGAR